LSEPVPAAYVVFAPEPVSEKAQPAGTVLEVPVFANVLKSSVTGVPKAAILTCPHTTPPQNIKAIPKSSAFKVNGRIVCFCWKDARRGCCAVACVGLAASNDDKSAKRGNRRVLFMINYYMRNTVLKEKICTTKIEPSSL
jgi:hypothetical protein